MSNSRKITWPVWLLIIVAVLLLLYAIAGFLLLPWWLERELPDQARQHLGWDASTTDVSANPFTLSVTLNELEAADDSGEGVVNVQRLHLNLSLLHLFSGRIGIDVLELDDPWLRLEITDSGGLNLLEDWRQHSPMASAGPDPEQDPATNEQDPGFPLVITEARMTAGELLLQDNRGEQPREFRFAPIEFGLNQVAAYQDSGEAGSYNLEATLGESQRLAWQGEISLLPFHSAGEIGLENLDADSLWHFVGQYTDYTWQRGRASLNSRYRIDSNGELSFSLTEGELTIQDSELSLPGQSADEPALQLTRADVQGLRFSWPESRLEASEARISDWILRLALDEAGQLNWASSGEQAEEPEPQGNGGDSGGFQWHAETVTLANGQLHWQDRTLREPAMIRLESVNAELTGLTDAPDRPVGLSLSLADGGGGQGRLNGDFTITPFTLEAQLELDQLQLPLFQAYLTNQLALDLSTGQADFSGALSLDNQEPELTGTLEGTLEVSDVESRLQDPDAPLLSWQSLQLDPVLLRLSPLTLDVPSAVWQQPELTYLRLPRGDNSIARLLGGNDVAGAADEPEQDSGDDGASGPVIRIQRLQLAEAAVGIRDEDIPGGFSSRIHQIDGEITALSNQSPQRAQLSLEGQVADQGSLRIEGSLAPFGQAAASDITLSGDRLAMQPLTPYFARFLGYEIASGQLELEMDYTLESAELAGENHIVLKDFALGESVESDAAVDAPVRLGLSLLRGSDGTIDLRLPVSGDLSNPQFSISEVIVGAFSNLVARAATAPFSLLGNLAGFGDGGEDLGRIGFAPGSSQLSSDQEAKLQALADALAERPQITLSFNGASAPGWDGPALILAEQGMSLSGDDLASRINTLEARFQEQRGPSELDRLRETQQQGNDGADQAWLQTLLEALADGETPESGALRQLAEDRASALRSWLTDHNVEADRLVTEPVTTDAEVEGGRVVIPFGLDSR